MFLTEAQKFYLEEENLELKQYIESRRPVHLPEYMEDFALDPSNPQLDELAVQEANSVLEKPLSFYGSYLMQVMHKKDEVLSHAVIQHLMRIISQLQEEKRLMQLDREAVNNVATLNFDLAQNDADRIKEQAEQIKELNKTITLNSKLVKQEKQQLYLDMKKKYDELKKEYDEYKQITEVEIEISHSVIERQKQMHQKLFAELRAAKILIEVPSLREQLPKSN